MHSIKEKSTMKICLWMHYRVKSDPATANRVSIKLPVIPELLEKSDHM